MPTTNLKCLMQSAEIKNDDFTFLILMMPTDTSIPFFIQELRKHDCTCVVRVCESKYSLEPFKQANIEVIDLPYQDGSAPSTEVINHWLEILQTKRAAADKQRKDAANENNSSGGDSSSNGKKPVCIAIHCVAGLGRAPVLVAIALMECGMKSLEVVEQIRAKRRGAINQTQLDFLTNYKSKKRLKHKRSGLLACFPVM